MSTKKLVDDLFSQSLGETPSRPATLDAVFEDVRKEQEVQKWKREQQAQELVQWRRHIQQNQIQINELKELTTREQQGRHNTLQSSLMKGLMAGVIGLILGAFLARRSQ